VSVADETSEVSAPDDGGLVIGTAGWNIPGRSRERFPGLGTHLERYARYFRGAEINTSFIVPMPAAHIRNGRPPRQTTSGSRSS
jgi:hypothetical protein